MGVIVNRSSSDASRGGTAVARRPRPARSPRVSSGTSPFEAQLARLARVRPGAHKIVSCYLKLEPRDRSRGKYLIKLKNRVRDVADALPRLRLSREVEEAVRRDLDRVVEHLRAPASLPPTQGIAIFACEATGLFESLPLPLVYRSRLSVDTTPMVRELASLEDEFGRILTVVLDRTAARFFEVTAFEARELPGLHSPNTRGSRFRGDQNGPGWGEHAYNNRIREEKQRHFEAVARRLFELDRDHPSRGIILGASGPDVRAVEPFLHSYLIERLMGTVRLSPRQATVASVHDAALAVREEWERATEKQQVDEIEEALGGGWAVNGVRETLKALARGQVRALLVHADHSLPGFRCTDSGRLAVSERDCRGEGDPIPVLDVIDEAIEDALRQHLDVNVVYADEARDRIDGLAALLRFR